MKRIFLLLTILTVVSHVSSFAEDWGTTGTTDAVGGYVRMTAHNGDSFTMTVTANEGYEFIMWTDTQTDENPRTFTRQPDKFDSFTAIFARTDLKTDEGITTVTYKELDEYKNVVVNLTVTPFGCTALQKWSNKVPAAHNNPYAYVVGQECEVLPVYTIKPLEEKPVTGNNGTITFVRDVCEATMTAIPDDGFVFYNWADDESNHNAERTITITDTTYTAQFIPEFTYSFDANGHSQDVIAQKTGWIEEFETLTPEDGYDFVGWSDDAEAEAAASLSFPIIPYCDKTWYALYTPIQYTISFDVDSKGQAIEPMKGSVESDITLPALSNVMEGWKFLGWKWNNEGDLLNAGDSFTPQSNGTMYAQFVEATPAEISGTTYPSVTAAIEAAQETDVIDIMMNSTENIIIAKEVTINGNNKTITGSLTIENGAVVTIAETSKLTVTNLYIQSKSGQTSGQLTNPEQLIINGNAYIDITLEADETEASDAKWYAIAVPFEVNTNDGVFDMDNNPQVCETNFRIASWDGDKRAKTGTGFQYPYCGTLNPGQFYMFTINGSANVWRFKAAYSELKDCTELDVHAYAGGAEADKGWNAIANPALYYTEAERPDYAYLYDNATSAYTAQALSDISFAVGSPFVVQVGSDETILFASANATLAPARYKSKDEYLRYTVSLTNGTLTDYLYLTAHTDAEEQYVIGRDLGKMRSNVPQLWTTAYGENLAAQDALLTNEAIVYDLTLNTPKAGTFSLAAIGETQDKLYLLQDGMIIWNLTGSEYTLDLPKGATTEYDLMVLPAQKVVTELDALLQTKDATKYIRNGHLFIHINGQTYNALGGRLH